ncbi:pyridine nucleotide-disulfide oxidoreductase family protein [Burkholderia humptydooensis]|uniref:Larval mesenchyme specific protein n=1 Tax=Burkholderia humptydooensis MSMB43 TaxID=441157 RepID=A0ABN0G3I5_9BURK|nr:MULTISPECIES: NAD(P)-binding domain-containing protein [Burkholderia]AJY38643.1 pyridine nucleotide-disulfide oxidoreductase family protein [Burkholderia sp. 2002721687]EIP86682.1 Larval mesenchyme specific protein [Burkholderia humptydooensis MSMB43]
MEHHSNVIIGGGPAGINMALEFGKRGIEYLLLEANETVGGQWDRFPVCGQLISLNKRYVPGDSHTYRMRYDWHTLSTISADDVANDPLLRFTEWTSEHWPSSRIYKEYLKYVAERKGVSPHVRTHARVQRIARESGRFVLGISNAQGISADRVFCATGKSEPIVPDIKGLDSETCTFYGDFEPDTAAERYRNKVVIVLGRGNSAFEIAHHLVDITAETRVVTRSLPMFARQTHNVHDLRAQVSDVFDLMQLKSNNNIVSDRIVEVRRITGGRHEGRLLVRYETPCPHWSPPRWMKRTGIVDDVFLGAPMRINDPDAASGFVHGFRCNIQALGSIVAEKYHGMAVEPVFECDVPTAHPSDQLIHLSAFLVDLVSTSMPLFELFGYFGSTVTFTPGGDKGVVRARVWPAFPRAYNLERWGKEPTRLEIVFEYGFSRYGNGELPTHYFTLPADHFDTSRSAYVHPVFHVYQEGVEVDSFHMQESLIGRWDLDDYVDEETNLDQYKNVAFNACASALGLDERRSMLPGATSSWTHAIR